MSRAVPWFEDRHVPVSASGAMRVRLAGQGPVTVLLDAGWGQWSPVWALVQPLLAQRFTTCAIDRMGLGQSGDVEGSRSSFQIVDELEGAIDGLGLSGPFIYVGHSFGAVHGRVLAFRRPIVKGHVFVDPVTESLGLSPPFRALRDQWLVRLRNLQVWSKRGLLGPLSFVTRQPKYARPLPRKDRGELRRGFSPRAISNMLAELSALDQSMTELKGLGAPAVPFEVLSASANWLPVPGGADGDKETAVQAMHRKLAATSDLGQHRVIPKSSHDLHIDNPTEVAESVHRLTARLGL